MDSKAPNKARQIIAEARRNVENCALSERTELADLPYPTIPGYEIVGEIHRGGQGVVYEAMQDVPRRRVAIKLLRHGVASSAVDRLRFDREAEVLGRLRHANIVTIHEAGVTSGCHYFVMDYIPGESLDAYMRHAGLSVERTVGLFLEICDAVGAAHQRGVLHRDLKPSNIQVDDQGRPHVLDFGLAADTTGPDANVTITGQFIGSLPWASPEQASAESDATDVRTDVYALGLILFHMLTERFPYEVVGPPSSVLDAIQNAEPARPSALRREVPYDLEQIILKCLSKERERRYQSVSELTADLRRFLAHEPISARGDSAWYKLSKAVRRHPRTTAALVGVLALTLLYATATTVLYRRAAVAEADALASAADANQASRALEEVYERLLDRIAKLERLRGTAAFRGGLVRETYDELSRLVKRRPDNRPISTSYAAILRRLGDFAVELGQRDEALGYFRQAAEIREALIREQPENLDLAADLSVTIVRIGDTLRELGDGPGGTAMYERALTMDQQLADAAPTNAHILDNLSWSYQRLGVLAQGRGEHELAETYFREELAAAQRAVELEPENPVRVDTLLEAEIRQVPMLGAREFSLDYAEIRLQAVRFGAACHPEDPDAEESLRAAEALVEKARAKSLADARTLKPIVAKFRRRAERTPDDPNYIRSYIRNLNLYAHHARDAGLVEDAEEAVETAIAVATTLAQTDPGVGENLGLLDVLQELAMNCAPQTGDLETALMHARAALESINIALQAAPRNPLLPHRAFRDQHAVGVFLLRLGREAEAQSAIQAAMTIAERAAETGLMSPAFQTDYGNILTQAEALTFRNIDRGLDQMTQAITNSRPQDPLLWQGLGNAAAAAGRMDRACAAYAEAARCDTAAGASQPDVDDLHPRLP